MASTFLSLMGLFPAELHELVSQRLTSISETVQYYETTETFFHRGPDTPVDDSNILRLRSTHLSSSPFPSSKTKAGKGDAIRSLLVFQKPDPISQSPEILSRMLIEAPLAEGDPFALASVLGYSRKGSTHQKGLRFQRGAVVIEVFQLFEVRLPPAVVSPTSALSHSLFIASSDIDSLHAFQSETSSSPLSTAHYILSVSTRCANPRPTISTNQSNPAPIGANPSNNPGISSSATGSTTVQGNQGGQMQGPGQGAQPGGPGQYSGPTAHELKLEATARIREVQGVLKGVVDLARVDV